MAIGVRMRAAKFAPSKLSSRTLTTPFVVAAVFYLVMTAVLTWGFHRLEAHFGRYAM